MFESVRKIKIPKKERLMNIPEDLKTESKNLELNTVDILFFSHDWQHGFLTSGVKSRQTNKPTINIKIPDTLSVFISERSCSYNNITNRELYIVNERSPFTVPLDNIPLRSASITVRNSHDDNTEDEVIEIELTQKMLSTLGTVRLIDDINEKNDSGGAIIFILGVLAGGLFFSLLTIFFMSK